MRPLPINLRPAPLALPNFAPVKVSREVWHSALGPLDVAVAYDGTAYEARATVRGHQGYILVHVPAAELRAGLDALRAHAARGVKVRGFGRDLMGEDVYGEDVYGEDETAGFFSDIVSAAKKVLNRRTLDVAAKIAGSPIGQAALAAVVGPAAAGVGPMLTTVSQATQMYDMVKGPPGPAQKKAKKEVKRLRAKAAAGNVSARAAIGALEAVHAVRKEGLHSVDAVERLPPVTREWLAIEAQRGRFDGDAGSPGGGLGAVEISPVVEVYPPDMAAGDDYRAPNLLRWGAPMLRLSA